MEGLPPPIDYLVVGHVTQDLTPAGPVTGGTVTYSGLTARALGLRTGIVTSAAGGNLPPELADFPAACLPAEHTTTFENIYSRDARTQWLRAIAAPLTLDAIPPAWRSTPIVHLGPLAQEFDSALTGAFPGSFVGLTPQGWLRRWEGDGRVLPTAWRGAEAALAAASAVVIGQDDIERNEDIVQAWAQIARLLVVTSGAGGATVYQHGNRWHFPAPVVEEIDPTGAGDIFAAVFFAHLQSGGDSAAAAEAAVQVASRSVERPGIEGTPRPEEVRGLVPRGRIA